MLNLFEGEYIMVPPQLTKDLKLLGPDVLDFSDIHYDLLEAESVFFSSSMRDARVHEAVVKGPASKNWAGLVPELMDEAALATTQTFAQDYKWQEINVFSSVLRILARTCNRGFAGLQLCKFRA